MHDTHVHLEMLLNKLGLIGNEREDNLNTAGVELPIEAQNKLNELIQDHQFLLQSTVSTQNYLYTSRLFGEINKIKYWLGSHPDIVNESFNINGYLMEQRMLINLLQIVPNKLPKSIVGIGEVGLDYFHTKDQELIEIQKNLFISQIELAIELELPLMIHCRDAFGDLFTILNNYPLIHNKFLIHCFTGGINEMLKVVELGGLVGIGGICTFQSAQKLQEAIAACPLTNLVLETDLPFLAPIPHRGQICLPIMIDQIATKIAELKHTTKDDVISNSLYNTCKLVMIE